MSTNNVVINGVNNSVIFEEPDDSEDGGFVLSKVETRRLRKISAINPTAQA